MQIYLLIPERGVEQTSAYSCRANTTTRASLKLIGPTGTTPVPGRLGSTHTYTHMLCGFSFQGNWVNTLLIHNHENTSTLDSQKQWESLESALHGYSLHFHVCAFILPQFPVIKLTAGGYGGHRSSFHGIDAFKSCWRDRIYEVNAHEHHHNFVITSGKL